RQDRELPQPDGRQAGERVRWLGRMGTRRPLLGDQPRLPLRRSGNGDTSRRHPRRRAEDLDGRAELGPECRCPCAARLSERRRRPLERCRRTGRPDDRPGFVTPSICPLASSIPRRKTVRNLLTALAFALTALATAPAAQAKQVQLLNVSY